MTAPAYGDTVKIYFGDKVRSDCQDYKRYYEYYNLTETEYGWQLYADETKKEMPEGSGANILPYQICGKKILSYTFNNVNATALWVPQEVKQLNITITNCAKLTSVRIYSPQTYIGEAAFAGAPTIWLSNVNFLLPNQRISTGTGTQSKKTTSMRAGSP